MLCTNATTDIPCTERDFLMASGTEAMDSMDGLLHSSAKMAEGLKEDCDVLPSVTVYTGDMNIYMNNANLETCIAACRGVIGCNAFTYVESAGECKLRSITEQTARNNDAESVLWKECHPDKTYREYDLKLCPLLDNIQYTEDNLKPELRTVYDPVDCIGACLGIPTCNGFTLYNGVCYFKKLTKNSKKQARTGAVSWKFCEGVVIEKPECTKFSLKQYTKGVIMVTLEKELNDCISQCESRGGCYGWSYGSGVCYLYNDSARGYIKSINSSITGISCHLDAYSEFGHSHKLDISPTSNDIVISPTVDMDGYIYASLDEVIANDMFIRHSGFYSYRPDIKYGIGPRKGMHISSAQTYESKEMIFVWKMRSMPRACGMSSTIGLKGENGSVINAIQYNHRDSHTLTSYHTKNECMQEEYGPIRGKWIQARDATTGEIVDSHNCSKSGACRVADTTEFIEDESSILVHIKDEDIMVYHLPSYDVPIDVSENGPHPSTWNIEPIVKFKSCGKTPYKIFIDIGFCKSNMWDTCPKFSNDPIIDCKTIVENYPAGLIDFSLDIETITVFLV